MTISELFIRTLTAKRSIECNKILSYSKIRKTDLDFVFEFGELYHEKPQIELYECGARAHGVCVYVQVFILYL